MKTLTKYAPSKSLSLVVADRYQELPTIINDENIHPTYIDPNSSASISMMMAPVEHIKLTRIVSKVLRDLYSIRPPTLQKRIELSSRYTSRLHAWHAPLSHFLSGPELEGRINNCNLIPIYKRQRSVLELAYHHALLLIHRPFLLKDFANLAHMPTHPNWRQNAEGINTASNVSACLDAAMSIVRQVDEVFASSDLFRSFWFTQYYAFCAVVILYIYRIQQGLGVNLGEDREGYFEKGVRCQRQLESVVGEDCLAQRYCLVLEELRVEAVRQSGRLSNTGAYDTATPAGTDKATIQPGVIALPAQADDTSPSSLLYNGDNNMLPTPDSSVAFNPSFTSSELDWSDLASWGQFEGLVTAGNGMYDPMTQGNNDFWFGS
jgi:hypothetical protein